jgi:hypothetical protein
VRDAGDARCHFRTIPAMQTLVDAMDARKGTRIAFGDGERFLAVIGLATGAMLLEGLWQVGLCSVACTCGLEIPQV